jgi:transposase-like protein
MIRVEAGIAVPWHAQLNLTDLRRHRLQVTVRKGQRRLDGLTGNVISLYAKGMTTGDIQDPTLNSGPY